MVSCYNPNARIVKREVYPNIGRPLTSADINKFVVRVYPKRGDFSFVPLRKSDTAIGCKLISLSADHIVVGDAKFGAEFLDNNWLTVNEFIVKTAGLAAEFFEIYDTDPPY